MSKTLGMAADFYRLRLIRIDDSDGLDLDWRDDILYREPPEQDVKEFDRFRAEAVAVTDDCAVTLDTFQDATLANEWLSRAEDDLIEMTRSEFEAHYFPAG